MILYKYMPHKALAAVLKHSTIRFTTPEFFNDPFDCAISGGGGANKEDDAGLSNILTAMHYRKRMGVLCLTRNPLNLLMWAHYADNHAGAVIGIDTELAGLECGERNVIPASSGSVVYTSVRPSSFGVELPYEFAKPRDNAILEKIFLHKSVHWAYEEEVRVTREIFPGANEITVSHRDNSYKDFVIPNQAFKEVYLGSRFLTSPENEATIQSIRNSFKDTRISKCHLSPTEWKVERRPIDNNSSFFGFSFTDHSSAQPNA
ncbi:DUF2971 domain-containing protein [Pseudomonas putida]|uniref:DUF2971 domain-containing protein n=1 Tax=Pseudomonas putida TaxID=303 RepID=UPI00383B030F